MSWCLISFFSSLSGCISIKITAQSSDPLIKFANSLDWNAIAETALPDLKQTAKGFWFLGRKLHVRLHSSSLVLQALVKETDRGIEKRINQTTVLQLFSGFEVLRRWCCPDHTTIEEFRRRLKLETQKIIGHFVLKAAEVANFADASWKDVTKLSTNFFRHNS